MADGVDSGRFCVFMAAPASAQGVAKRTAKRAAKDATKDAAGDAAKKAAMTAMAPDAIDLNAATPEQMAKLGFDEATVKKVVDSRPFRAWKIPNSKRRSRPTPSRSSRAK